LTRKIFYKRPDGVCKEVERQEVSSWGFWSCGGVGVEEERDKYLMRKIFYSGQMELVL
jgi:hypothetical protein